MTRDELLALTLTAGCGGLTDPDQARRICVRLEALCRN